MAQSSAEECIIATEMIQNSAGYASLQLNP